MLLMCVRPWTGVWTYQASLEAVKLSTVACSEEAEAGEQAVSLTGEPTLVINHAPSGWLPEFKDGVNLINLPESASKALGVGPAV